MSSSNGVGSPFYFMGLSHLHEEHIHNEVPIQEMNRIQQKVALCNHANCLILPKLQSGELANEVCIPGALD